MAGFFITLITLIALPLFLAIVWDIIGILNCCDSHIQNLFSNLRKKIGHLISKNDEECNPFKEFYKYLNEIESSSKWPSAILSSFIEIRESIQKYQSFYELAELRSNDGGGLSDRFYSEQVMIDDAFRDLRGNISNFLLNHKLFEMRVFNDQKTESDYGNAVQNFISNNESILDRVRSSSDFSLVREEKERAKEDLIRKAQLESLMHNRKLAELRQNKDELELAKQAGLLEAEMFDRASAGLQIRKANGQICYW